jgi:hypothetical protein
LHYIKKITSLEERQVKTTEKRALDNFSKLASPGRPVITYKTDFYSSKRTCSFQTTDVTYSAAVLNSAHLLYKRLVQMILWSAASNS